MPRRKQNARHIKRSRKIYGPRAVMISIHRIHDDISPGKLVAAAEWRERIG